MWIQEWVDERFGVPNTVNIQVYEDFAKEVGERIIEIIEDYGEGSKGITVVKFEKKYKLNVGDEKGLVAIIRQALKGESNE